jgi:hypothetical protein
LLLHRRGLFGACGGAVVAFSGSFILVYRLRIVGLLGGLGMVRRLRRFRRAVGRVI